MYDSLHAIEEGNGPSANDLVLNKLSISDFSPKTEPLRKIVQTKEI